MPPPASPPPPPAASAAQARTPVAAEAKMAPPPFPPPGLPPASSPGTDHVPSTKLQAPTPATTSDAQVGPAPKNTAYKKLRNLGPPPAGPAPPPPVPAPLQEGSSADAGVASDQAALAPEADPEVQPRPRERKPSTKSLVDNLADNGTISGGTGGTVDFGLNSENVIEMMAQQAQINQDKKTNAKEKAKARSKKEKSKDEVAASIDLAPGSGMKAKGPDEGPHAEEPGPEDPVVDKPEDEVDLDMEAMVEELAGVNSFTLLEDAFSKVDAARDALSKAVASVPSDLRLSAPSFVPGQMWTGAQMSSFVD